MQEYGLIPLSTTETAQIEGGNLPAWAVAVLWSAWDNLGDFADGFKAGYKAQ